MSNLNQNTTLQNKKILITGGAGFIGSACCGRLIENNKVTIFDNLHRNALEHTSFESHPNLTFIQGDVMDYEKVLAAVQDQEYIIHMASIAGVDTVLKHPVRTMEVALIGTYNMLKAIHANGKNHGVKRFIDFSSSEVFGKYAWKVTESDATSLGEVGEARWTYAVSKLATEHLAHNYHREMGLASVAIRPFNIYGPRQQGEGAVHHFIRRAIAHEPITIHNDGAQIRSWCYIDDIVNFLMLACTQDAAIGQSFNVGNPRSTITIYNLAQQIIRQVNSKSKIEFVEWNHPDVELRIPNIDKARAIGFKPQVELEPGLNKTIAWYRDNA